MHDGLVDRRVEHGALIELHRTAGSGGAAGVLEVRVDGRTRFVSNTARVDRSLAELTLAPCAGRQDLTVLLVGLGMGAGLRAALDTPGVIRVDVVEPSRALRDWNETHLAGLHGNALADPRVHVHEMDVVSFVLARPAGVPEAWHALVLDVESSHERIHPSQGDLYLDAGLDVLERALRPGGVLGLWTAENDAALHARLSGRLVNVAKVVVPTDDVLSFVYRGRRAPERIMN